MEFLTEDEKLGLSPEEIAAIEDDENPDDLDLKAEAEVAAEAAAKEKAEQEAKEKADADAKAKEEAETKAKADAAEDPGPQTEFMPLPSVPQEELASLKQRYEVAKGKFDDGDIDYSELDQAKDAYNEVKWKTEFAEETNQALFNNRWEKEQKRFLDENNNFRDVPALNAAFVSSVNKLISTDEGKTLSDRQVLVAAKKSVEEDLGATRSHSMDSPGVDVGDAAASRDDFKFLDRLEGEAYQEAIDKLTPAQLELYEDL